MQRVEKVWRSLASGLGAAFCSALLFLVFVDIKAPTPLLVSLMVAVIVSSVTFRQLATEK